MTLMTSIFAARLRHLLLGATWAATVSGVAEAQANPDSVKLRNDCRLAAQTIATGHPAPHIEWAFDRIPDCGSEGATALATAIRAHRAMTDTAALDRLTTPTRYIVDAGLFQAALDLLADASASEPARIFAVRSLLWTLGNHVEIYYGNLVGPGMPKCAKSLMTDIPTYRVSPLPVDAKAQIIRSGERLWNAADTPPSLRAAASCLARLGARPPEREP